VHPRQEIAFIALLVLSLQVEDDRIMNFEPLFGLEIFHFTVIELSSLDVKIQIMALYFY
jgi:hypothetical protein